MGEGKPKDWSRDPERSRQAILEAAEKLFAFQGYEETSLQEIGRAAGVSRGTPNYFFGSKEDLYGAVLNHLLAAEATAIQQALSSSSDQSDQPEARLSAIIGSFFDFLTARPTFIKLIEREAINGARFLQNRSSYVDLLKGSTELLGLALVSDSYRPIDPLQLLLSIVALCWFPLAHTSTFIQPLGFDTTDPAFWESRKQHIIDLVLHGLLIEKA